MRVYHGSLETVESPKIIQPARTLDYGCGFYTTTAFEQAERWIKLKKGNPVTVGYVNVYDIDDALLNSADLNMLRFKNPTSEWVDFVMKNRIDKDFVHDYDIVWGPVANDRVYAAFALFENELLDKEGLIRELKTHLLFDQVLFHTEQALSYLKYTDSKEIRL